MRASAGGIPDARRRWKPTIRSRVAVSSAPGNVPTTAGTPAAMNARARLNVPSPRFARSLDLVDHDRLDGASTGRNLEPDVSCIARPRSSSIITRETAGTPRFSRCHREIHNRMSRRSDNSRVAWRKSRCRASRATGRRWRRHPPFDSATQNHRGVALRVRRSRLCRDKARRSATG